MVDNLETRNNNEANGTETHESLLWQLPIELAAYAPDIADHFTLKVGKYLKKITVREYIEKLYVERSKEDGGFEKCLEREMISGERILCVAGERGAGKTSAIEFVKDKLSTKRADLKFVTINLKRQYDQFFSRNVATANCMYKNERDAYEYAFKLLIREQLRSSLIRDTEHVDLIYWLLSIEQTDENSELLKPFYTIRSRYYARFETELRGKATLDRRRVLCEYFGNNPREYEEVIKEVEGDLLAAHFVNYYLYKNTECSKIIIVIDNVDRIPDQYITAFLISCRDIRMALNNTSSMVIGIRAENIKYRKGIPGDDQFFDLLMPDYENYSGLLLLSIEEEHMKDVFARRENYILNLIELYAKEWLDEYLSNVSQFHTHVVQEFIRNSVYKFANGSYLTLLRVYIEFMRYLWTVSTSPGTRMLNLRERIIAQDNEKNLQTLFYVWLQEHGDRVDIPMKRLETSYKERPQGVWEVASVHHLLLTCTLNLTTSIQEHRGEGTYPKWCEVVNRMSELKFRYAEDIRPVLKDYVTEMGEPPGILRFVDEELTEKEIEALPATSEKLIAITPRGKEIAMNILHKVGYIWSIAITESEEKPKFYFDYSRKERARDVYYFTKRLARKHLKFLSMIVRDWRRTYGDEWLKVYRQRFGVATYHTEQQNLLQVERILFSSAAFFDDLYCPAGSAKEVREEQNPFLMLQRGYTRLVADVARGIDFMHLQWGRLDDGDATVLRP